MKHKIELVDGDDWKGLYIDGKLAHVGHEIDIMIFVDCLDAAGIELPFEIYETFLAGPALDALHDTGWFPQRRG